MSWFESLCPIAIVFLTCLTGEVQLFYYRPIHMEVIGWQAPGVAQCVALARLHPKKEGEGH